MSAVKNNQSTLEHAATRTIPSIEIATVLSGTPIREYNQERRQITSHRNDGWMADIMLRRQHEDDQSVILALQFSVQLTVPLG